MKKLLDWLEGTCTIERGLIVAFVLMWSVFSVLTFKLMEESYIGFERSNYEAVEVRYLVKPGDTFWDVTEFYREMDDRHPYLPQFQYDNLKYNPDIEARGGTIYPGDIIRIKYYRRK